jgi:hypothetical protein
MQMIQLSATRCSCIAILWVSLVNFCCHIPLCCFSTSVSCRKRTFRYRLSPVTFGYTFVYKNNGSPTVLSLVLVSCLSDTPPYLVSSLVDMHRPWDMQILWEEGMENEWWRWFGPRQIVLQIFFQIIINNWTKWRGMQYSEVKQEIHTKFWSEYLSET